MQNFEQFVKLQLNQLDETTLFQHLYKCCSSKNWVRAMIDARPYTSANDLFEKADSIWWSMDESDWLESFLGHPKIGDMTSFKAKFQNQKVASHSFESEEQSGASNASEEVLAMLAAGNAEYESRFGHIFLICATGKSAEEMLNSLQERLNNNHRNEVSKQ